MATDTRRAGVTEATDTAKFQGYVDAGGLRTYYEAEGAGEPLVLLHGGLCTVETYGGLTPQLAQHYRVYVPERRGHGRTADVEGPNSHGAMADDTIAFMEAVGLQSANVVGWSDGGMVALYLALRRPELVRRLVIIESIANHEGDPPEAAEAIKLDHMPPDFLPPMLRDLYAAVSPDGGDHWEVVADKMWQMMKIEPTIEMAQLAKIPAPTLVVVAEHGMVTLEHATAMSKAVPDGELAFVPGADHGFPMQTPEVAARLVLDFLGTQRQH